MEEPSTIRLTRVSMESVNKICVRTLQKRESLRYGATILVVPER